MRVHFFQHVPFEGLGSIGAWFVARGAEVTGTYLYEGTPLPDLEGLDLLIVMGGPMSVNDEVRHPWLWAEKRFMEEAIRKGKTVLGVCLGAQLVAGVLGARVYPNPVREIGWFPVYGVSPPGGVPAEGDSTFGFPGECLAFHWHGETFDLPAGAIRLARSEACLNQAFQYGRRVIGLQCHLETTPQTVRALLKECRDDLVLERFVQSEAQILSAPAFRYRRMNRLMGDLLSFLMAPDG